MCSIPVVKALFAALRHRADTFLPTLSYRQIEARILSVIKKINSAVVGEAILRPINTHALKNAFWIRIF